MMILIPECFCKILEILYWTFNLQKFSTIHLATSTYSTKIYNITFSSNSNHHMTTMFSADYVTVRELHKKDTIKP